jgi:bifunctional UDP-N-acetylglucosamine pyrophosphorylase/glucosamine-1-phosphate N-acetyltransferase
MNVVILAAGQGTRMRSARPKVLHPLAGRPMLAHVIDIARALDPKRIVVVYGHGGEAVPEAVRAPDLEFVCQEPQLGTGHAVQQALPLLSIRMPTLVLYGDVPLTRPATLRRLIDAAGRGVAVLTAELPDPTGYGRIVRSKRGKLLRIVEHKDASAEQRRIREINTGILVANTAALALWLPELRNRNAQREYYLTDVIARAVKEGVRVASRQPDQLYEILGVNSQAQLAQLERVYQFEAARALLERGVTLADPARIDVRGTLECADDVSIDVNCVFEGRVTLGAGVRVGANCVLRDSVVADGAAIEPFSLLDGARVGARARVGPYARLRPGAELDEEVHVGNFVEVKASRLGARSKANHLAYVGDATVGCDVNIGAGTITCNYDGADKHRTVIGDDVHIGSDVQLVAPVTVGAGATVGAGTTVWHDVPPGGLTVNDKTQRHRADWRRPAKAK